jgi:hypothetical protein
MSSTRGLSKRSKGGRERKSEHVKVLHPEHLCSVGKWQVCVNGFLLSSVADCLAESVTDLRADRDVEVNNRLNLLLIFFVTLVMSRVLGFYASWVRYFRPLMT